MFLESVNSAAVNTIGRHRDHSTKLPHLKGKGFPYSTPSVGPGADPGVQAVSPQVTVSHTPGGRLPLLSARKKTSLASSYGRPMQ